MVNIKLPLRKTKGIVPCHVYCKRQSLTMHKPIRATSIVAILQAKTVVKASFVRVYNTCTPHDSQLWMGKTYMNMLQEQGSLCKCIQAKSG